MNSTAWRSSSSRGEPASGILDHRGRLLMVEKDVAVIGAGPGGYVAAIRAAQLGLSTVCIEKEYLGGVCLNVGCIPTKALIRGAELFETMRHAERFGIKADNVSVDYPAMIKREQTVVKRLVGGVAALLKS